MVLGILTRASSPRTLVSNARKIIISKHEQENLLSEFEKSRTDHMFMYFS